ncbi:hypothetical protein AAU61_17785 [Desulfocarbo indianensis]|nr:hypothetical protein AAU61_17785 [Desulfocarbo indianensis]
MPAHDAGLIGRGGDFIAGVKTGLQGIAIYLGPFQANRIIYQRPWSLSAWQMLLGRNRLAITPIAFLRMWAKLA